MDAGAVIDCSGPHTFSAEESRDFFAAATTNLLVAMATSKVCHFVLLSIVDATQGSLRLLRRKGIARRTSSSWIGVVCHCASDPVFEFAEQKITQCDFEYLIPAMLLQPIAAATVAKYLVDTAIGEPINNGLSSEVDNPKF